MHGSRIVYQIGADLHLIDVDDPPAQTLNIQLASDFDQMREQWITKPMNYLTAAHLSPDGDRVVLTARGELFVAPRKHGRLVQVTREPGVRYRHACFMPDGDSIVMLSDESDEVELWKVGADGYGEPEQLTDDGRVTRFDLVVSPDGRYAAYQDKDQVLWVYDLEEQRSIEVDRYELDWYPFGDLTWSPDSRMLAYVVSAGNSFLQIKLYDTEQDERIEVTSDRVNSSDPAFSKDGTWLYFVSQRHFKTLVSNPWGHYQPEPLLYDMSKLYVVSLTGERRSPFELEDELTRAEKKAEEAKKKEEDEQKQEEDDGDGDSADDDPLNASDDADGNGAEDEGDTEDAEAEHERDDDEEDEEETIEYVLDGLEERLLELPVEPGNYGGLAAGEKHLFWISSNTTPPRKPTLKAMKIDNAKPKPDVKTVAENVVGFELSLDRKAMLIRTRDGLAIVDAGDGKADLSKNKVDLGRWRFTFDPREQWRQMFIEAWRLERDYFYAPNMHGVDWEGMLEKYLPLVDRVTTRAELSDAIAQMVSELSALHIYVFGGDARSGEPMVAQGSLGARLERDAEAGGYRITRIYETDPTFPDERSPLAAPHLEIDANDVITHINGVSTTSASDIGELLRNEAGRQVRLRIVADDEDEPRDVIVRPISVGRQADLRYDEWELTRRRMVEEMSDGQIGYVHLRAMGGGNYLEFAKAFYPVFDKKGLIIDVRHNRGGNIDSWILSRLAREAWMYWQGRVGKPTWNMQYAFRGHMVCLMDQWTMSDGEAFAEGFRRLGLGELIGAQTWGGGIWLSFSNLLVDGGIASAAESGVFAPEGRWIIEMDGVEPDIVVDNPPHETFMGRDAQLEKAVEHLLRRLEEEPVEPPVAPDWPDKSFRR
jgi:tricorn protease